MGVFSVLSCDYLLSLFQHGELRSFCLECGFENIVKMVLQVSLERFKTMHIFFSVTIRIYKYM